MANGFMNPFGTQTAIPFLFGEDPASQQARESFQAAGDVAQQVIGLKDPRSPEAQQEMEMVGGTGPLEAFLPVSPIGGLRQIGGLQKLSRFGTSTPPRQLPVLRGGQQPVVTGSQVPATATTPPSTFVRGTGPKRVEGTVVNPLATTTPKTGGGIIPSLATLGLGGALVTDQVMQDPSQEQGQMATAPEGVVPTRPKSPIEIHTEYLKGLEEQGVSADERARIASRMLEPFLKGSQAESRAAFDRASDRREAELEFDEAARRSGGMTLADYRALARQGGMKGSAVEAFAKNAMKEQQMKERKSEAELAATEALTESRLTPKPSTLDKDLADIESRFLQVGVPFRDAQGNLTESAQIALLQKGRISEIGTIGSGLEETILLDRQGNQRRVPNDQVEEALASGYTRFVDEA
jgi:hypothetical protein